MTQQAPHPPPRKVHLSDLQVGYQKRMFLATLIVALVCLIPSGIWYINDWLKQDDMVIIPLASIQQSGSGIKLEVPQPDQERYGTGQKGTAVGGHQVSLASVGEVVSGFVIVPDSERLPVATSYVGPDLAFKPTPLIDEKSIHYPKGDDFGFIPGNPDGDGWPIKETDLFDPQPVGTPNPEIGFSQDFIKPKKNRQPYLELGAQIWPKEARRRGIYTATIKVKLYMDETGSIIDEHGKLRCEILEEPKEKSFRYAFFQMLRNGYYQNPIIDGVPYGFVCTITYEFCNGPNCDSYVIVVSGDVIADQAVR